MGDLFLCLNYFFKHQHQYFASVIESMQDNQYLLIRVYINDQKFIEFISFIMIEVMFVTSMQIRLNVQFL